jgi:hypothetical protein
MKGFSVIKNITDLMPSDVILHGGNRTAVKKVSVSPDGCRHKTHINDSDCYENFTDVMVKETTTN